MNWKLISDYMKTLNFGYSTMPVGGYPELGEKQILTYSVDYYLDTIINGESVILVIEYDEPAHLTYREANRDINRQREIEDFLGPTCIFLRYNERTFDWRDLDIGLT